MLPPIWHGTLRDHYLLLFGASGLVASAVGSVAAWLGAQFGARRAAQAGADEALRMADALTARRLEVLQQAVESMAVEVERIAEAQRFSARLLAERAAAAVPLPVPLPAPRPEPRVQTPH